MATAAAEAPAPSPSPTAAANSRPRRALEELSWDDSFVRELPGDPRSDAIPREVLHACYTKVSPSAPVDNPKLVAWSQSVADILDLDHKEFERPDFPQLFSGTSPLVGSSPYSISARSGAEPRPTTHRPSGGGNGAFSHRRGGAYGVDLGLHSFQVLGFDLSWHIPQDYSTSVCKR